MTISTISTQITNTVTLGNGTYATNLTITNTGTIAVSAGFGLYAARNVSPFTITNLGTITDQASANDQFSAFFSANDTGIVINSGLIQSSSDGGIGFQGPNDTLINTGLINASLKSVYSLLAMNIVNQGTIDSSSGRGIFLFEGGTVTDSGTITGSNLYAIKTEQDAFTLIVDSGAVFNGNVIDQSGTGQLTLAGATAGSLNMAGTFSGFSSIAFGAAAWTLGGTTAELASGETISGFTAGDELILSGVSASSETFITGTGLVLTSGTTHDTISLTSALPAGDVFELAASGTTTTITAGIPLISIISTPITSKVTLGNATYAANLTITNTGTVKPASGYAIYGNASLANFTITNQGTLLSTSNNAVDVKNTGTILNSGTISGAGNEGIIAQGGGYFENTGLLKGTFAGFALTAGIGSLANLGGTISGGQYGVRAGSTLAGTNTGVITGTKDGIYLGQGGSVSNSGTVAGGSGYGIFVKGSTYVKNSGLFSGTVAGISSNGGSFANLLGTITGEYGVHASGTVTGTNTGTITGTKDGVFLEVGGSVTNAGTITGGSSYAILAKFGAAYVKNSGLLSGVSAGIGLSSGGSFANLSGIITGTFGVHSSNTLTGTNTGTITGTNDGLYLEAGGFVTNAGTITGGTDAIINEFNNFTLAVDSGAVFAGAVLDNANNGVINLAGATAGSLNMAGTFTGFSSIAFGAAAWTLGGTTAELAAHQTISGFTKGDELILSGFSASSETFVTGTGLVLSNGTTQETISLTSALPAGYAFNATASGTTTTITAARAPISIISTPITSNVTLGNATYAANLTITNTGTVKPASGYAIYGNASLANFTITNQGTLLSTSDDAIDVKNTGTILNSGTISGAGNEGIIAQGGGYFENTGLLKGTVAGFVINGGTGSLANLGGTISGEYGVFAESTLTSSNTGRITGTKDGIYLQIGGSVTNAGTITGGSAYAIFARGSAYVKNSGLLSGTFGGLGLDGGGSFANLLGTITGDYGVRAEAAATGINTGTITVTREGIYLEAGGSVTNAGIITGGSAYAIYARGSAYVKNSGLLSAAFGGIALDSGGSFANLLGTITSAYGVRAEAAATGTNTGTITGTREGIYLELGGFVTNAGTITGGTDAIINEFNNFTLAVDSGAVFAGAVLDNANNGVINLAGATAGSLNMAGTFTGFSSIAFGAAAWTLGGTTAELAAHQTISGFTKGDKLILSGFSASSETFVTGTGLVLSNATASETIGLNSLPSGTNFYTSNNGTLTTISALISTISTPITTGVTLGNGTYAANLTVTKTGTISTSAKYSVSNNVVTTNYILNNQGTITGGTNAAIDLSGNSTLVNSGIIATTGVGIEGNYINNTGLIAAAKTGINIVSGTVINSGTITSSGGFGISTENTSYIQNRGVISGENDGIFDSGDHASFSNLLGTISGQFGVFLLGDTVHGTNSGTIIGSAVGLVTEGGGYILNSGTIIGADAIENIAGAFTLSVDAGAVFQGAVVNKVDTGVLNLAGTTAGSLNLGGTFTGFSSIAFGTAPWTLGGTTAELASGETISGFTGGDELILSGFSASSETFVTGTGLVLSNGTTQETISLTSALPAGYAFNATASGTTITAARPLISIISTPITTNVTLGNGTYATNLTITNTGTIAPTLAGGAIYGPTTLSNFVITNQGDLATGIDFAIFTKTAGTLLNSGTITSNSYGVHASGVLAATNSGTVAGGQGGFYLLAGGSLNNSGTISGGLAIRANASTTIGNTGDITGQLAGVVLIGGGAFANQLGTISGNLGVYAVGVLTGTNSGTITGTAEGIGLRAGGSLFDSGIITAATYAIYSQSGAFTLSAAAGAAFQGKVVDKPGTGVLTLAGATAGSLNLGGTFTGFSSIAFGTAPWTLAGTAAELASNEAISGFTAGDTLILSGFSASSDTFVVGTGLVLSNATASETIGLNSLPSGTNFYTSNNGTLTTISALISTISTPITTNVTLDNGTYATGVTITNTGTVTPASGTAISTESSHYVVLTNQGEISSTDNNSVQLNSLSTLLNSGIITGSVQAVVGGLFIQNTGVITAVGLGLTLIAGTVANNGTISSSTSAALNSESTSTIQNSGLIAGSTDGLLLSGQFDSFTNLLGTISGQTGVLFLFPGNGVNTGTISGTKFGIETGRGGSILNSGTIGGGTYAIENLADAFTLSVDAGAVFQGTVLDKVDTGVLNLAGTTAGSLDMGSSFIGFNQISFSSNDWTLGGTTADLASGQTISGFTIGDSIELENIAASTSTYANGTLTLFNGSGTSLASLDITAPASTEFLLSNDGTNSFIAAQQALCFLAGTFILTSDGEKPIEALNIGDEIVTRFGGVQKIKWLGRQSYAPHFIASNPDKWPVRITQGALDGILPRRDLCMSPGHSVLIGEHLILARNLVNGITIRQEQPTQTIDYINIEFSQHDCVQAEGAWSETYADAPGMRAQFHNAAAFLVLYPDHVPVRDLTLCAPRPQAGADLETALRPVVEAATARITLGALDGYIDILTSDRISGWARDTAHPHLPVLLDIVLDHEVIATILACDPRGDLAAAGLGNCAFAVTLTEPLTESELAALTIQRHGTAHALPNSLPKAA